MFIWLKFVDITQNFRPKYNGFSYRPFLKNIFHERQKIVSSFTSQKNSLTYFRLYSRFSKMFGKKTRTTSFSIRRARKTQKGNFDKKKISKRLTKTKQVCDSLQPTIRIYFAKKHTIRLL